MNISFPFHISLPKPMQHWRDHILRWLEEHLSLLLRIGVILGTILGALIIPIVVVRFDPVYALILAALPAVVLVFDWLLQRQYFFPALILFISTITAFYVSKGITPALILTAAFTALWALTQMLVRRRIALIPSAVNVPVLVWILVCIVSLFWSWGTADPYLIPWDEIELVQLAQLAVLVLSPVAMLLTANLLTEEKHLRWLVIGYLLITTYGIVAEIARLPFRLNVRGLNSTWVVGLFFALLLFKRDLKRWQQLMFVGIIGMWLYRFFYVGITWLSGWLPIMVMVAVITFFRSRQLLILLLIAALIAVAAFMPWWESRFADEYDESGGNRLDKWEFLFNQPFIWNHVLLGTGPFGYARYFMTYFPENSASTHSNYIDIFLQTGIVGSLAFLWMVAAIAWEWWKVFRTKIQSAFLVSYRATAIGGLIAILVAMFLGDWFTPFVLNQGLHGLSWTIHNWIFLGALLALPTIIRNSEAQETRV